VILQHRATNGKLSESAISALRKLFNDNKNPDHRMRAMWSLHITSNFKEADLQTALSDKDEYVRAWAIQLLCEDKHPSKESIDKIVQMSKNESSAVVRLYLAAALQRVDVNARWLIAQGLITR
jgi:HEAT repeat protein